jgi:hypothetical protein
MYKAIPHYGADRKREASMAALKALGGLAAFLFLAGVLGWLGDRLGYDSISVGTAIGIGLGWHLGISDSEGKGNKILPIRPVLWDEEVDCTADR